MEKIVIPIVFAANDNFSVYCYTAIYSVIKNARSDYFYHIYILETNINNKNRKMLESLSTINIIVKCIDISNYTLKVNLKESLHLSIETYYRLFIPCILPQYEKILYLDSDMCILSDVSELYQCNLNDYAVGAALDIPCYPLKKHSEDLGGLDCRKTFNAGVLVIDTVKFEENKIREKCLALLEEDFQKKERKLIFADQDALNIVLYEDYCVLDKKWNYQPQYLWRLQEVFEEDRQEYITAKDEASIIHFAGDRKPWKYPDLPKSDIFWKYVREVDEFEKIISHIIAESRTREGNLKCFDEFQFPYAEIPFRSKVVIYAAGNVGKAFYRQLKISKYADLVLWVDQGWKKANTEFKVEPIEKILTVQFDYLIIAIDSKKIADEIREDLLQMGVPTTKIVWEEYRKNQNC